MKKCRACGETKELDEFNNNKKTKDGKQSYCKDCMRQYNKQYRNANKEKISAYNAEWRKNNSDYQAEWQKNNREKVNAYNAKWKRNNREKANAVVAEWRTKAQPSVYRIKNKTSGHYYIGQTTHHFCVRVSNHFSPKSTLNSPFTGLNKDEWDCEILCYGTEEEVKHLEKALLNTRVGQDPLCLNKST